MTFDEAMGECVAGLRVRCAPMQEGCYVEHSMGRGFLRCFPVDKPEDEPLRTQSSYVARDSEYAADWTEAPGYPKAVAGAWGIPEAPKPSRLVMGGLRAGKTAALASVGFVIPDAVPAIDVDDDIDPDIAALADMPQADFDVGIAKLKAEEPPKRDVWGREID